MKIGVPKEIKPQENRIGLTPDSVKILTSNGHEVLVENNSGFEAGFYNDQYKIAGAKIVDKAEDIFDDSEIIVKVKEPLASEVKMIRENQIIFTYLHLAAAKELTEGLIKSKAVCIAYETVTDDNGRLPLLAPMSAVAGRMSIQAGAHSLEKNQKGRGLLLGGAPGVDPAKVVILGGGVVGENAALIATGMKAKVHIVDKSEKRLEQLKKIFQNFIHSFIQDILTHNHKDCFIEDNTWNILFSADLLDLIPNAKIISVIRDPRDVVASLSKQKWMPSNKAQSAKIYNDLIVEWIEIRRNLDKQSWIEVRLEDVVLEPESQIRKICDFIELPWEDNLLKIDLSKSNSGQWKKGFSEEEQRSVIPLLAEHIKSFGYE